MKRKSIAALLILPLLFGGLAGLSSCQGTSSSESSSSVYTGDYRIVITPIGSTTIKVSRTVQLRSSVTGTTQKDVTWSSSDPEKATVSSGGLVTGLASGTVSITASLNLDPACQTSIDITVEAATAPTAITIQGAEEGIQWVGESKQLTTEVTPTEASNLIDWSSSASSIASITETGLVSFLSVGTVRITATSKDDNNVKTTIDFNVKNGFFRSDVGSPYWDISKQANDEDACAELPDDVPAGYHSLYLNHVMGQKYYVEATFDIKAITSSWVWQGIGIGSGLSESDTRYFIFSPRVEGQGNDYNKTIVKDLPNESWPAITTRSQIWGENGLDQIDFLNSNITIGMLRNGNEHYWLINGRVHWYDNGTKYENVDTMPIIVSIDIPTKIFNYTVTTDTTEIDAKLASAEYQKSFYSSNPDHVTYTDDSSFSFNSTNILSKDHKVRALGDKAKLVGDFVVECDVKDFLFNAAHTDGFTGLTINFSRYDSADTVESFMVGKSAVQEGSDIVGRYASWNYQLSMDNPSSMYSYLETDAPVFTDPVGTHHLKITRTNNPETNKNLFRMWVDGVECVFDVKSTAYVDMTTRYTGAYLIWVGGEYTSCAVSNFTFSSGL